jgi:Leucine-rich repeat (LRR) protein
MTLARFRVDEGLFGKRVVATSGWDDEISRYILDNNIRELFLNYALGWKGTDLSFLERHPGLNAFSILDWEIKNITPIHLLHDLLFLEVSTYCNTKIDFEKFPKLEDCRLEWRRGCDSLFNCKNLRQLRLNHYPIGSSTPLGGLAGLQHLWLASSGTTSLEGLSSLARLTFLGLSHLRKLKSLAGIETLANLETLDIEGCRHIGSIAQVQNLNNLKNLYIADCGKIQSLKPLARLEKIESVVFYESTDIVDGDLSPLSKLKHLSHVSFRDRSHYSHALVEFPTRSLPGRRGLRP